MLRGRQVYHLFQNSSQSRPSMNRHTDDVKGAPAERELARRRLKVTFDILLSHALQSVHRSAMVGPSQRYPHLRGSLALVRTMRATFPECRSRGDGEQLGSGVPLTPLGDR